MADDPDRRKWGSIARSTFGYRLGTVLLTVPSGIILAQVVGPDGRGVVAAAQIGPLLCGWLFSMGAEQALAHDIASKRIPLQRLLAAWLVILLPLSLIATAALQLALPAVLGAQEPEVLQLARLVALTAVPAVLTECLWGLLLGTERFSAYNVLRFLPSAGVTFGYVVLATAGHLTPKGALFVAAVSNLIPLIYLVQQLATLGAWSLPRAADVRSSLSHGLRLQGATLGTVANTRLDALLIPAFVSALGVGLYSVATNVSFLLVTVAGALYPLLIPIATRSRERAMMATRIALVVTIGLAGGLAAILGLAAPYIVPLVYGADFEGSVTLLRVLLPGTVAYAATRVLVSALIAAGRPLSASMCELAGVAITIPALVITLPRYGVLAAAIVSSAAYTVVFASCLLVHKKATSATARDYVPSRTEVSWLATTALSVVGLRAREGDAKR